MSNELEFSITEKEAEDIAVRLLSTRMMKEIEKIVAGRRKDIAEKLGVSPSYVSQLFSGDKVLNLYKVHKIQKAYHQQANITFRPVRTMHTAYSKYRIEYSTSEATTTEGNGQVVDCVKEEAFA